MDTLALRKARGSFFTPPAVADFIAQWAIRESDNTVLEPSCGDAEFLLSAAARLRGLGASGAISGQLNGVEIHEASADSARKRLGAVGADVSIALGDFFDQSVRAIGTRFDAVIGNPPYVRYQQFSGEARAKGLQAALAQGVRLTGLASSWAAFTIHTSEFLKPNGRLGLVLPAELLTVNYASQVRRFLLKRFSSVKLVLFEERVFPGVIEDVVLLLAEGSGGAPHFEVYQARNLNDLDKISAASWTDYAPHEGGGKWTPALVSSAALEVYDRLITTGGFDTLLGAWGETYLGAVTGNNEFFTLSQLRAAQLGIPSNELMKISPPGSKHLRGLVFSKKAWEHLASDGKRAFLFAPGNAPSPQARCYIKMGEADGVHLTYKCRNRSPWWRVPPVERPDLLFTYMNHDRPRVIANEANAQLLNSLYGVKLFANVRSLGTELLPLACLNSATLLGAEVVGRAYGGGMLKHEPKEADLLPVPSPKVIAAVSDELRYIRPPVSGALRLPELTDAVAFVDRIVLERFLGLTCSEINGLREAREHLFQRRISRSRGDRTSA